LQDYRLKTERDLSLTFTGGGVEKRMHLSENRLEVSYRFGKGIRGTFTTEINLAMPSCDGPAGKFVFAGQVPGGFGQLTELDSVRELLLEDDVLGGTVKLTLSEPARLVSRPHFSVSQSEAGFEKIMQAVTLTLSFPLDKIRREVHVSLEVLPKQ